ncbi:MULTISPECIES: DUF2953 domain-containing protein [Brevibacillus]|uniref:DUF2953 domain-containing protein n=1 Tax=Brevibacillus TaxID=55080 RepID=UPI00156AC83B|nr:MULTISPECIES: DUF2953 domain-containing protein [Brevibacillus]MBU8715625.1 DUF2953 domain-containing protein [Brevibacillus parabrevis]MDH6352259.1 hypothetical protein [Brevibacillus sp. 1238]MDR4998874.1 DUF2953 domain-containing protein [Brevibacillus parabrevis]UED67500.1 DUF2953 domain-containing protein [Brevibacillus sp. HD3.3A]
MWAWVFLGLLVLLLLLVITPVKISCYYHRKEEDDQLEVELEAWHGLFSRKYELPILLFKVSPAGPELVAKVETIEQGSKVQEKIKDFTRRQVKRWYHNYRELVDRVRDLLPLFRDLCKQIHCTKLEWHTLLGTGQAAETGAITGVIWGVKSLIVGVLSHSISLRTMPAMSVQPVWNDAVIQTTFRCVFRFYLGHFLFSLLKIAWRIRKTGQRKWHTSPSQA